CRSVWDTVGPLATYFSTEAADHQGRQGELAGARRVFDEALVIHRERGDKSRAATVLNNIALLFEDEGSLAEAKPRFEESLQMLREIGDRSAVARTVGDIGELLLKRGDLA